jgi:adenylate cyclase class 2
MPLELELKVKVHDFDAVRKALTGSGAKHVGSVLEVNTFFDTPDKSLLAQDKGLRLRRTRDDRTGKEQFVITVKGPAQPGPFKSREEAETDVDDGDRAAGVLQALGFRPELSFEKRRESWTLDGCKIELDELPILGRLVEIEGPDETTVSRVRDRLGLTALASIKTGYIALLSRHLQETGDKRTTITFDP